MRNPFAKSRPQHQPYAIYRSGHFIFHVCKTYKKPANEVGDIYARWFVWASSPFTHGSMEAGDTYRSEIVNSAQLVAAEPEWLEHFACGVAMPTPKEYINENATLTLA